MYGNVGVNNDFPLKLILISLDPVVCCFDLFHFSRNIQTTATEQKEIIALLLAVRCGITWPSKMKETVSRIYHLIKGLQGGGQSQNSKSMYDTLTLAK